MKSEINPLEDSRLLELLIEAKGYTAKMEEVRLQVCEVLGINPDKSIEADEVLDALYGYQIEPRATKAHLLERCGVVVIGNDQIEINDNLP
jgi:hypothetical protein